MGDSKEYLKEGDVVTLKQDVPNKPIMVVSKLNKMARSSTGAIERERVCSEGGELTTHRSGILTSIQCFWFDKNQKIHEKDFNFKDLRSVQSDDSDEN
jgi:hypothetical protein